MILDRWIWQAPDWPRLTFDSNGLAGLLAATRHESGRLLGKAEAIWANCGRGISLLSQGRISLKPLATHSFPLGQIEEAFRTFTERIGGAIKVIVHPNA